MKEFGAPKGTHRESIQTIRSSQRESCKIKQRYCKMWMLTIGCENVLSISVEDVYQIHLIPIISSLKTT